MARTLTTRELYADLQERLDLHWVAGQQHDTRTVLSDSDVTARPALAGYLNLIHPNRLQVLGPEELAFLDGLEQDVRQGTVERICGSPLLALVVGNGLDVPPDLAQAAEVHGVPLLRSSRSSYQLVTFLQHHLSRVLAHRTTRHGVFMEVFTIGVLITGDPGAGKSELALELLNRGHRLIADDAPEFTQISPEIIDGTCPEALQDCLEVRGLGVLNVRRMFGDAAIKLNKFLRLIVHLRIPDDTETARSERLAGDTDTERILELDVPRITLPVLAGRNLAVMAEAAVRDFMLRMKGYDAASSFVARHDRLLRRQQRQGDD